MFVINRNDMENETKSAGAKSAKGKSTQKVYDSFKLTVCNIADNVSEWSKYDMCQWINNIDRWIDNQSHANTKKYGRGTIVHVDLGAQNFKYEPSYAHPCIILAETKDTALVVPCSSKKYGCGYSDIIDADVSDGFSVNTGIKVKSYRWVHKNRIISAVGHVSGGLLDKIDKAMLSSIPTYKAEIKQLNAEISQKQQEIEELNAEIERLKHELTDNDNTNN